MSNVALQDEWGWVTHWTDLLDQDEVWRDTHGAILRLDDMDPDYCARVRDFCLRNAERALTVLLWEMTQGPTPSGEVAADCFNREYDMLEAAAEDPQAWLLEANLLRALSYRARGLPARPASATCPCG
ncbi:hypothetical protein ABZ383_32030, partial [Streptomyces sp. NPDC005900]|uniref:hypothetical protein n=1 Tax=Streptomyces sp. NPDC005900 TaxID=3154569 RepID=UPI00340441AF